MYIILSQTPDKDGFQGQVALNTNRINGFREVSYKDIGGNPIKDKSGYAKTYTEITMRGNQFFVVETIETIKTLMEEKPII